MEKNRILIADDSELNRDMLTAILGDRYEFLYAANGVEAVDMLRGENDIDLVLLDINMPLMDGFEVLHVMNERNWIDEFPVIIISATNTTEFMDQAYRLGAVDYIGRPFNAMIVQRRVENTLLMYSNQKHLVQLVASQVYDREKNNNLMINIFSNIIELRNHESGNHTLSVQIITELLLKELVKQTDRYSLSKSDVAMIASLSALHDIGKIKVPEAVLNKPGRLTDEEWVVMKSHTLEGDNILKNSTQNPGSKMIRTARQICRSHHEKYDGKGYPDGLAGDDIPIAAQVVSVADAYDALTNERCYKDAYPHETAVQMLLNGECGTFNPILMKCLVEISDTLKKIMESGKLYDYQSAAYNVADELLADRELPVNNSLRRMMANERKKKEFFMECSEGIQCEYDRLLNKVTFVYQMDGEVQQKILFTTRESEDNLLPPKHWSAIREKLLKTTRDDPAIEMDVELHIMGKDVPYHVRAMAIWPEDGSEYIFVEAHFTKIKI